MYGETLGRWRTADLLIGLAYLAKREGEGHPVADIAAQGRPIGEGASEEQRLVLLVSVYSPLPEQAQAHVARAVVSGAVLGLVRECCCALRHKTIGVAGILQAA